MGDALSMIGSLVVGFLLAGGAVVLLIKARKGKTRQVLERQVRDAGDSIRLTVGDVCYSGADFSYSKVKNKGVLIVGDSSLYFQHYLEKVPSIVLPLDKVQDVTLESSFRGELSILAGGSYLVIHTTDNNHIGFLAKEAGVIRREIVELKK